MNIPEQEHIPDMPMAKKYVQFYPTVTKTIEEINRVFTELEHADDMDQFSLNDKLILNHPAAILSAAFITDCNKAFLNDLVSCLKGHLRE